MRKARGLAAFIVTAFASLHAVGLGACSEVDRPTCYAGDYESCSCGGGAKGFATCAESGEYGACVCSGGVPGIDASARDASPPTEAAPAPSNLGFLEACTANEQCASGLCQNYPARGMLCSKTCTEATQAADCPPPSPGCTKNGVCKAP